jgi:hypothetical protein
VDSSCIDHENEAGGRSVSGEVEGEGVGLLCFAVR